jgi:hypothetical protein
VAICIRRVLFAAFYGLLLEDNNSIESTEKQDHDNEEYHNLAL